MQDDAGTLLRSFLNNALRRQTQRRIRDFGGYEIGKRRKPDVIATMADEVAEFLCTYLDITANGRPATREGVVFAIAQALGNVPDELAYRLTSRDDDAWRTVCESVAVFLEACMEFDQKPYDGSLTARSNYNGWKDWEVIVSGERPRGKWRHAWKEKPGDDFIGFDGETCMGRIFKIDLTGSDERWYWLISADGSPRRGWPAAGYEASARSAACRVERIYFALVKGEARAGYG
ncbi:MULTISPECIES: hypothetical protein [unclassified Rhizobium]|uniref:hypothetical protein n=1 Tax=unclassified Rhizobium TaxID=2613769 RepID=UPI0007EC1872|nr:MULTISPECIES: hypothetical protein [unclassified Rhizobium]ANK86215.1 hypothetical protein AMK02_CH02645 [Rhizobium sp. N731]ANL16461.1 hypothetical protein AMJ97_CH02643 [Rhizobium sp. N1314]